MSNLDDMPDIDIDIDRLRDKVHAYAKTRLIIKVLGVIGMFIMLFMGFWLTAVMLWILFFPDLNDIIGFIKKRQKV